MRKSSRPVCLGPVLLNLICCYDTGTLVPVSLLASEYRQIFFLAASDPRLPLLRVQPQLSLSSSLYCRQDSFVSGVITGHC